MTSPVRTRICAAIVAAAALLTSGADALSRAAYADAPPVAVSVRVISAANIETGGAVARELVDVAPRLTELFGLNDFRLIATVRATGTWGVGIPVRLPQERLLEVVVAAPPSEPDQDLSVRLSIAGVVASDYRVKPGGVLVVGGMKYADGRVMALAVTVDVVRRPQAPAAHPSTRTDTPANPR